MISMGLFSPGDVVRNLRDFTTSGIVTPDGVAIPESRQPPARFRIALSGVNERLLRMISSQPSLMQEMSARQFEELVAEVMQRQGYTVELTPATRDGGKDIYVAKRSDLGSFLYLVECKKYALDNPVGVGVVRALYGTVQYERATAGIVVTSSTFTRDARDFVQRIEHQMSLRDYVALSDWIRKSLRGQ
jgi:restriction system protein